jgi:hypothetical protein
MREDRELRKDVRGRKNEGIGFFLDYDPYRKRCVKIDR